MKNKSSIYTIYHFLKECESRSPWMMEVFAGITSTCSTSLPDWGEEVAGGVS